MILLNRRRIMGEHESLPYDAEVQYLQGDGVAYINTGIKPARTVQIKIHVVDYFNTSYGGKWLFGGRVSSSNGQFGFFINGNNYNVYIAWSANQYAFNHCTTYPSECDIEMKLNQVKIGNTTHTFSGSSFTGTQPIHIFGLNNNGSNISNGDYKIGASYITDGTTTLDLIPVRKNGVGYMYDKLSGELLGTPVGAFTIGPDKT